MKYTELSDCELIKAISMNDEHAFMEFYSRHNIWIYRKLKWFLRDKEEAMNLSQDIWEAIWKARNGMTGITNVKAFFTSVIIHKVCREWRRQNHLQPIPMEDSPEAFQMETDCINPEFSLTEEVVLAAVDEILLTMPELSRKIYRLRRSDYSVKETAEMLGVSCEVVRTLDNRAKNTIREKLGAIGIFFTMLSFVFYDAPFLR